jgi:hypothetical protein
MSTKLPFTSVVSLHTNEYGCGVAKFSKLLAERLGVPFVGFAENWGGFPLLSLKASELGRDALNEIQWHAPTIDYAVFWHDAGEPAITKNASVVYYADTSLGSPGLWCPSLLTPSTPRMVNLFSFGMAHKIQVQHYATAKRLLDAAGIRYHLRVSVGIHEGTSLSDATAHFDALYELFGRDRVTILGILSDDAVAEELRRCDAVLAFFEQGVRANNTTVHAALEARRPVVTNHGPHTSTILRSLTRDVSSPTWIDNLHHKRGLFSWDALITSMEVAYERTEDWRKIHR